MATRCLLLLMHEIKLTVFQAQLRVVKEESKETEERLLRQLKEVQVDRNTCLEAACRADKLLMRFGDDDKILATDGGRVSSPRDKARALEDLHARLAARTQERNHVDRATAAIDGVTAAGTKMLQLRGRDAHGISTQTASERKHSPGRFAQLFQELHPVEHPKAL